MPPRRAKKTTVTKSKVSTPAASSPKVEMAPCPSTVSPAAAVEDTTGPKEDSFLKKDQTRKPDPIMTAGSAIESDSARDGESSQIDPAIRARPAKKRVVAKVAGSTVRKEAVASVARDQIEKKTGSLSEKETQTEKSEASKDGRDGTVEEPIEEKPMKEVLEVNVGEEKEIARDRDIKTVKEGEENTEKTSGEKEIEEIPVSQEVKDEGEKIEKTDTEELAKKVKFEEQLVEEGEPIEEEAVEEVKPIEEEAVEEVKPIKEETVEEVEPIEEEAVEEGEPIEEDSVEEVELIEEEPLEEEEEEEEEAFEEEEEPTEQEQVEEEPMEEEQEEEQEEEEEKEEEPIEEEAGEGDGNEEIAKGRNNEENREIVAVKGDVQLASVDGGGGGEDQGLGDMLEPTMYLKDLLPNRRVKDAQIFISQLEKTVVEEDIVKAFAGFGEIQSVRVIRHSKTQKSKGYAFLQYSTAEAAEKALSQLKDGTEIKGKAVHISASNQGTLFVGNICKSWSKDQVLDALKGLGVEGIDQIALPEDPKVEGKSKGFAFVEFCTHIDAKAALNRLCKPDAVLGCDYSAKVSFAQLPVNYIDELQAKVKTVYLEPVPMSWDGKKIEEICKEYGAIEKIKLYRKSQSRRKDFAFVEFVSQESALSCVEGLSKALLEQDDTKVSASLARPYAKKTGTKFILRGNFKVKKSNEKGEKEEARIIKKSDEKVEKEEVKIIEVSGNSKRKRKRPKSKGVIAQKPKPLSPQKTIKKNKMVHKKGPNIETPKETPRRNAPKKKANKEAPVPVNPQGSRKRPFKEAPESSKRPFKGKMKQHEKGMRGEPHPHQSGAKKSKPFKGSSKQHQRGVPSFNKERGAPAFNNERDFKRSRNDHYGNYQSHHGSSPIDRRLSLEYAYAPHSYTRHMHEPPYASTSSIHEPPYTASMHEPSRREPYTYTSGSYHSHHSDLAPHAGYVPPTHHVPRTRHVYEPSAPAPAPAPAPYGGGYDRPIVYTREPPIPLTTLPGFVTYPRYQQPSYPYPTGRSYPADYPPRRSYY